MSTINHDAELARAGANITGWGGQALFMAGRYPLGAVGALIVTQGLEQHLLCATTTDQAVDDLEGAQPQPIVEGRAMILVVEPQVGGAVERLHEHVVPERWQPKTKRGCAGSGAGRTVCAHCFQPRCSTRWANRLARRACRRIEFRLLIEDPLPLECNAPIRTWAPASSGTTLWAESA